MYFALVSVIFATFTTILTSRASNDKSFFNYNDTFYHRSPSQYQETEEIQSFVNISDYYKQSEKYRDRLVRAVVDKLTPEDRDVDEAEAIGIDRMNELSIEERNLHTLGIFLAEDNPARYVALFNQQSKEAKYLAAFAYAALEASTILQKKYPLGMPIDVRSTRTSALNAQCPQRPIPRCNMASLKYRTSDGSCNNLRELSWGSAMSTLKRFLPPVYNDEIQEIRRSVGGGSLPSPRRISNIIHRDNDVPLVSVSHMLMQWGQFVDHDIVATAQSTGFNGTFPRCCLNNGMDFESPRLMHPDCLPIAVSADDTFFGPLGVKCLEFVRSSPAPRENCMFGPREQLSQVTSFLDASMVYSSSARHMDSLRSFEKGTLLEGKSRSNTIDTRCQLGIVSTECLKPGDGRMSEQPALVSMHIIFLRLHNSIAVELAELNHQWSDERIFQETRRIVGALIQLVTFREYLPVVLGPNIVRIFDLELERDGYYGGYDDTIEPNIANSFSTAAYRFGHSLVQESFLRVDSHHRPVFQNITIHNEPGNRENLHTPGSLERLLLGLVKQPCQKRDEYITSELTNHLFQTPNFKFGMDLASINIQRGRDHGLKPYIFWRLACGLSAIRDWNDFERVTSSSVAQKFRHVYGALDDVDLFPAGLAEKPVNGGLIGPTFACIVAQQFSNLRKGDRFWFENSNQRGSFTVNQLLEIRKITLAKILCRSTDNILTIQPFVFLTPDSLKNQRISCDDPLIGDFDLGPWKEHFSAI